MNDAPTWLIASVLIVAAALFACKKKSPESVCQHMVDLAKDEGRDEADEYDDCVEDVERIKRRLGDDGFDDFAKCVLGKDDFDDAREKCDPDKFD